MDNNIVLARGAEAVLYLDKDGNLVKERIEKGYRAPQLDKKLRSRRTRLEAKLLREARRAGVATPQVSDVGEDKITMEFVDGDRIRGFLNEENYEHLAKKIGVLIATLHQFDIIHGDLTTSNMILKNDELYLIDFGLGFISSKAEDKAVDLYLLYHALESTHWQIFKNMWRIILKTYNKHYEGAEKVIKTLFEIEKRGRYKER